MQTQPKRCLPPSGRRWRRRSVLTWSGGVATIVDVVLARGTDAASLRALRATCTTLRDALSDVTAFRLRERCAHEMRVLPKSKALKAITARLVEEDSDGEEGLSDSSGIQHHHFYILRSSYASEGQNGRSSIVYDHVIGRVVAMKGWQAGSDVKEE